MDHRALRVHVIDHGDQVNVVFDTIIGGRTWPAETVLAFDELVDVAERLEAGHDLVVCDDGAVKVRLGPRQRARLAEMLRDSLRLSAAVTA